MSARKTAVQILEKCRKTGSWSSPVIDEYLSRSDLQDERDRRLVTAICLGVMQNSSCLDYYIDWYAVQDGKKMDPVVRDILRTGVYQMLFLDKIPDRAVVNETVAICDYFRASRAKSFVNAVLRKIASHKNELPEIPGKGTADYLSIRYSHPKWICDRLIDQKGYEFAEAFLQANNTVPDTDIQINTVRVSVKDYADKLEEAGISYELPEEPKDCIVTRSGNVSVFPGFAEGEFFVQDLAARFAVDAAGLKPGMHVIDTCASPGGKSFSAAVAMQNRGEIISCDISQKKVNTIISGAERLGLSIIHPQVADGKIRLPEFEERFDAVIADVPCSGIGVIRKKPEIRNKTVEEISGLPEIQYQILSNVCSYARKGGILVYSTCTVLPEENEGVCDRFLQEHPEFEAEEFVMGDKHSEQGRYTFWPNTDGTDGFFVAKFRRKDA